MEILKEFKKLITIPLIMIVITIVILFITEESIRRILLGMQLGLLAIHISRCANFIDKQKRGE